MGNLDHGIGALSLDPLPYSLSPSEFKRLSDERLAAAESAAISLTRQSDAHDIADFLEPWERVLLAIRNIESQGRLVFMVHPDAAYRTVGREVSERAEALLARCNSDTSALVSLDGLDLQSADAATKYAVEKMRRSMRQAGASLPETERGQLLVSKAEVERLGNIFAQNAATWNREIPLGERSEEHTSELQSRRDLV